MKTSFHKFMASNAVNKVELSNNELIQVQMGAKEDLIKLIGLVRHGAFHRVEYFLKWAIPGLLFFSLSFQHS